MILSRECPPDYDLCSTCIVSLRNNSEAQPFVPDNLDPLYVLCITCTRFSVCDCVYSLGNT
jgi:hypothetical protein